MYIFLFVKSVNDIILLEHLVFNLFYCSLIFLNSSKCSHIKNAEKSSLEIHVGFAFLSHFYVSDHQVNFNIRQGQPE